MTNELQKSNWQAQIDLVKQIAAKNATHEEFTLMCHIANKYGLDPLVKQIWVVKYGTNPASIFTGRDGFLHIAHQTGKFGGLNTKVEMVDIPIDVKKQRRDRNGQTVTISVTRPWQYKATCTIYRTDSEHPFTAEVYEDEYTTCENLWQTKPRTMIGKVAESQCLRKAFDITGIRSPEEDDGEDITPTPQDSHTEALNNLPEEIKKGLAKVCKFQLGETATPDQIREWAAKIYADNQGDVVALEAFLSELGAL